MMVQQIESPMLLVDDNPADLGLMQTAIEEAGGHMRIDCVHDGVEAVAYLRRVGHGEESRPCLVILDVNMPRLNGLEVLDFIRRDPALHDLQVVVMTTSARARDRDKARELGAVDYIVKPLRYDALLDVASRLQGYVDNPCP
jgi:CheY-like chemotaxis protein